MKFYAFHGVLPEEQTVGNHYVVTIQFSFDFGKGAEEDDLEGTINYADVYELVKKEMQQKSKLIEHVAQRILNRIVSQFPKIQSIEIIVSKLHPPLSGEVEKSTVIISYPDNKHLSTL